MTLGLESGRVLLANAHGAWAAAFEEERARILTALGDRVLAIEHVGSTAIPGVPAKPILDILVGVGEFKAARACIAPMERIGYTFRGEHGIAGRHYFVKGDPRTHHVHMVETGSGQWQDTLAFRDRLRGDPELAGGFAREKVRLARRHPQDRRAYQQGKDRLVETILKGQR